MELYSTIKQNPYEPSSIIENKHVFLFFVAHLSVVVDSASQRQFSDGPRLGVLLTKMDLEFMSFVWGIKSSRLESPGRYLGKHVPNLKSICVRWVRPGTNMHRL